MKAHTHTAIVCHWSDTSYDFEISCGNTDCYLTHCTPDHGPRFTAEEVNDLGNFTCRECFSRNLVVPLKRFRVSATMETYLHLDIWSTDADSAYDFGRDFDGGDFTETDPIWGGDWRVTSAEEIDDEEVTS